MQGENLHLCDWHLSLETWLTLRSEGETGREESGGLIMTVRTRGFSLGQTTLTNMISSGEPHEVCTISIPVLF